MHLLSVFSLRNRALIALITVVIGIFGAVSLTTLKQELFPSIDLPQLVIVSSYPGASPAVVEHDVSTPIETSIQGIEGLDTTTATSQSGASTVSASFQYGTDITNEEQKVQLAIDRLSLPSGVQPQVIAGSIADLPVVQLAVTSDLSNRALTNALNRSAVDDIQQLDGVREASLLGTVGQRVTITPDETELAANGLTVQDIKTALSANGTLLAAGSITENAKTLIVQSGDQVTSVKELQNLPVLGSLLPQAPGAAASVIPISSVATVKLGDDPKTGISRVNGKPSLTVAVTKKPDGNTVEVSKEVIAEIPTLEKSIGHNTKFTVVFDQAPYIQTSINDLTTEGLLGLAFAIIVIFLFLWSLRPTLVAAVSIPISVLITFIGMLASGYTLNIITLGALTIAIGRVVDDSIVVIENIKRHVALGEDKLPAILAAVREVAVAVTASTLTTVAVFLPLAIVGGEVGELFKPFALTVTIALISSLFVALTIVPVLAYWFLRSKPRTSKDAPATAPASAPADIVEADELEHPSRLQKAYLPIIGWTIRRPVTIIVIAVLVLLGTGALARGLQTNFIGSSSQNTLTVTQTLPLGASLTAENVASRKVETALRKVDGVDIVQTSVGSNGNSLRAAFGGGAPITFSITTDADADQDAIQADVKKTIDGLSGVGTVAIDSGGGFTSNDITITITARNDADLRLAANRILNKVSDLSVTSQASSNLSSKLPFIDVKVDRAEAAAKGLSELQVGGIVAQAMNPSASGTVTISDSNLDVYINNAKQPMTTEELENFSIPTATGVVPLSSLATVAQVNGPASITTIKGVQSATVTVTPNGQDIGTASASVQKAVTDTKLPAGATAELGGVTSQQGDAFSQLLIALLVAILIVYIVMVATFKSLRQPLLLLVSIPFAATGAIILQRISGIPLGVSSIIGLLMLVGIVVTNAIVLVDLINQYRRRGFTVRDSILHGASRRLRPILMTALATIFALLPMATGLTGSGGGFISQPLAIVVIGGLISSTVLTLIVLPVLYYLVEGRKERRDERRATKVQPVSVAS